MIFKKISTILLCKNLQPITKKEFFKNFLELIKVFVVIGLVWFWVFYFVWKLLHSVYWLSYGLLSAIFSSGIVFIVLIFLLFQNYNFALLYQKFYARIESKIKTPFPTLLQILNIWLILVGIIGIILSVVDVYWQHVWVYWRTDWVDTDMWIWLMVFWGIYIWLFIIAILFALCIPSRFFENTK